MAKIPPNITDFPQIDSMDLFQSKFIFTNISRIPEIIVIVEIATTYFCTVGNMKDIIPFLFFGLIIKTIKKAKPHHRVPEIICTNIETNWMILSKC